ncbi:S8 family serine peptidase [Tahibacter soli]|uniref:S8 family serine peptidase n=1 Tax=Tahibacter soli TaxID=2983605 RepID=A0A9X4BH52_9GAMM|nr:S8 family serine peptidase [Tahibacter soli]MDC8011938.1 S8 family serine peptidase [Tahibacter soli]
MRLATTLLRLTPLAIACASFGASAAAIDPPLARALAAGGTVEAIVAFDDRAVPALVDPNADVVARRTAWIAMLRATAERSQSALLARLRDDGVEHRAYWINNTVWVRADAATIAAIAQRDDVAAVYANAPMRQSLPPLEGAPSNEAALAVEWGVAKIRAPEVWAAGFTGQGVVVSGQDTGYQWDHPALKAKYRGWNGATADHNYNWHDGIHSGGVATCPANSPAPCDDNSHGTHTMGTIVGADGANQIGVAPDARWIGCRNMNSGTGTPQTYIDCMQWLLAPTDLAGGNPDPAKAPDVINNSWGCPEAPPPTGENCTPTTILQSAVDALVDGGIFFVASAGNGGSSCSTITDPPAIYAKSFVVGSTTSTDAMSSFSSRGPVAGVADKPDVSAPGSNVRSSVPGNGYGAKSGTSMAGPHVAGAAALVLSAAPSLRGHPDQIAAILRATSVHITSTQVCGGVAATTFPNPVQGYGRIDAYAAVQAAIAASDAIYEDGFEP